MHRFAQRIEREDHHMLALAPNESVISHLDPTNTHMTWNYRNLCGEGESDHLDTRRDSLGREVIRTGEVSRVKH